MTVERYRRFASTLISLSAPSKFALAGLLAIILPAIVLGPWLPLLDLVGFVGINNYPPDQSYGPLFYAVFQYTYIIHYALSRFLYHLGFSAGLQILCIYLLEASLLFWVIQATLRRFIANTWLCSTAIVLGTLAFWDGLFLWGGPTAFSLAVISLSFATLLSFQEIDIPGGSRRLATALLLFLGLMCHPFIAPFALLLVGLRFFFVPNCRRHSILLGGALMLYAWIIYKDGAENPGDQHLKEMFVFSVTHLIDKIIALPSWDVRILKHLFGSVSPALSTYCVIISLVHLLGFVSAPVVALIARESRALRMLAIMITGVAFLYFIANENGIVSHWPQRILSCYSPFTFVAGIALPLYLLKRFRPAWGFHSIHLPKLLWAVPVIILGFIVLVQVPLFRHSKNVHDNYIALRTTVLKQNIDNAFIVLSGMERISPFYLRCVPFLLFSDPEIVARNIIIFTEWHLERRHPVRLTEQWFDLGRPRLKGMLSMQEGRLALNIVKVPNHTMPVATGSNWPDQILAKYEIDLADNLVRRGCFRDAVPHFRAATELYPKSAIPHHFLAIALSNMQAYPEAIAEARKAVSIDPTYAEARAFLGYLFHLQGKTNEGIDHLKAAITMRPDVTRWRNDLITLLMTVGRRQEANQLIRSGSVAGSPMPARNPSSQASP